MSIDATRWAWMQRGLRPTQKIVLLSLADRANEEHICWPSLRRLSQDTELDERTVNAALRQMCTAGIIARTAADPDEISALIETGFPFLVARAKRRDITALFITLLFDFDEFGFLEQ